MLAKAQAYFFLNDPHDIRVRSGEVEISFVILGAISLILKYLRS